MSDTTEQVVELLREVADELESGDAALMKVAHQPPVGSVDKQRLDIEWVKHE